MSSNACHHDERGSSTVSFLIALPLLCLLVAALVDFGRLTLVMSDMAAASEVAARHVAAFPSAGSEELRGIVVEAAPSLSSLDVSVNVAFGTVEEGAYEHHFYEPATKAFSTRTARTATRPFTVSVRAEGPWLTPAGALAGEGLSLAYASKGAVDMTVEGGSW